MNDTICNFDENDEIEKSVKVAVLEATKRMGELFNMTHNLKLVIEYATTIGFGAGFDRGIEIGFESGRLQGENFAYENYSELNRARNGIYG